VTSAGRKPFAPFPGNALVSSPPGPSAWGVVAAWWAKRLREGALLVAGTPAGRELLTERLHLVPIGLKHVADLVVIHRDPWIAQWWAGEWSAEMAETFAQACARGWIVDGVAKWIAYERRTGELVGRGGLSRMELGVVGSQIAAFVGPGWAEQGLELGWSVREAFRGQGYATEMGRAGLSFAFEILQAQSVISFTERHNVASRNVMERLGLQFAGEISARGLIEGKTGEHDNAPFALYAIERDSRG
jgi:RimJ/RimL family protein N-acetyltransferase